MTVERRKLLGRWVHAHEEDTDQGMVFRPADHELPPSRGRLAIDLREDGSFVEGAPGPTDRPEETQGTWELGHDDVLVLRREGSSREARVVGADPDRIVLAGWS
jgi:hypothetical protein